MKLQTDRDLNPGSRSPGSEQSERPGTSSNGSNPGGDVILTVQTSVSRGYGRVVSHLGATTGRVRGTDPDLEELVISGLRPAKIDSATDRNFSKAIDDEGRQCSLLDVRQSVDQADYARAIDLDDIIETLGR